MIPVSMFPTINATLNSLSAILLAVGYVLIRRGKIQLHRICMLAAFGASALFLISYLFYHVQVGSIPFTGQGFVRPVYYALLLSHIILAASVVPLALVVLYRGLKRSYLKHQRLARRVLPLWIYVSITGVVVYLMLYHLFPSTSAITAVYP